MKFSDIRGTVFKGTPEDEYNRHAGVATPRRVAPQVHKASMDLKKEFKDAGFTRADLMAPQQNREYRRAMRKPFGRNRLRHQLKTNPHWFKRHMIEVNMRKALEQDRIRRGLPSFDDAYERMI
ncbi:hypothetical protein HWB90_gp086 [Mycobacterium phage Fowlmouth]|uniref:Uncharacterized protein n=2 Tax=Fowlmouthvirus fowlmouth TaxID=2845652 RepID=A0A7G8LPZ3_9CAUD|nr:hypothetical protein HWB90_gp086 [Mycobacterium phage Fowlmouth]AYN58053.1 hypothetical protein SEA_FOWLMOUTH_104 [Mycobacterium phage Fowlmouth]QNJ59315.1 hypothetical protein SEA_MRMIYAGI_102 [Mycobacterium phage MrMiyagi]